jgi:putative flippase GtrA
MVHDFSQFFRFVIVGGSSALLHYVIYLVLLCKTTPNISYGIGYLISFLYNYLLTTGFTFGVSRSKGRFLKFTLGHVANYLIQLIVFNIALFIGVKEQFIPIPVYAISVLFNFLLLRKLMSNK